LNRQTGKTALSWGFQPFSGWATRPPKGQQQEETMSHKYEGGCDHHHTHADADPIDNHTCHCSVCKRVTGQPTTHVVFFKHGDLSVENAGSLKRMPFNDQNPDGPLQLCVCETCGTPIMLDDKENRIRVIVPNLMGHDTDKLPATYHAIL
jgi:hypothetical protein